MTIDDDIPEETVNITAAAAAVLTGDPQARLSEALAQLSELRKMLHKAMRSERRLMADNERLTMERDFSRAVLNRARTWAESTPVSPRSAERHLRASIQDYDECRDQAARRMTNQREGTYVGATYGSVGDQR